MLYFSKVQAFVQMATDVMEEGDAEKLQIFNIFNWIYENKFKVTRNYHVGTYSFVCIKKQYFCKPPPLNKPNVEIISLFPLKIS